MTLSKEEMKWVVKAGYFIKVVGVDENLMFEFPPNIFKNILLDDDDGKRVVKQQSTAIVMSYDDSIHICDNGNNYKIDCNKQVALAWVNLFMNKLEKLYSCPSVIEDKPEKVWGATPQEVKNANTLIELTNYAETDYVEALESASNQNLLWDFKILQGLLS